MKHYLITLSFLFLFACKESPKQSETTEANVPSQTMPSNPIETADVQLPSISQEEVTALYENCDYIDFIFYELPFSMSYSNKAAIATALSWISPTAPVLVKDCPPLGRMVYQSKGEVIIEAEIILNERNECGHLIWIKDGQRLYANRYNANGKKYMLGIIQQNMNR